MSLEYYNKKECRLCKSKDLVLVFQCPEIPLADEYLKIKRRQNFYSLELFLCKDCNFVQIGTIINNQIIYKDYLYISLKDMGLSLYLESYVNSVLSKVNLKKNSLVIDIGCNDTTLLHYFKKKRYRVLGLEPPIKAFNNVIKNSNDIDVIMMDLNTFNINKIINKYGKADLITINNLFANIDQLERFSKYLIDLLNNKGFLIIESSYLISMIENRIFDFIYHEHLSYFSIEPLSSFFNNLGLRLFHLEETKTKGGSMRYFFCKTEENLKKSKEMINILSKEQKYNISKNSFLNLKNSINTEKEKTMEYIKNNKFRKIVGYGASATSTVLINYFELGEYIDYLVDENTYKVNTYSPSSHIPVYSIDKLNAEKDVLVIILAWRFVDQIVQKLELKSKSILLPLPKFKIIGN